jgi:tetratricopeptide (TPR) repeat protein
MNQAPTTSFIFQVKEALNEAEISWVIAALRQDKTIWEGLQESHTIQRSLWQSEITPTHWSPALLSLLAEDETRFEAIQLVEALRSDLNHPLDAGLKKKSASVYETTIQERRKGLLGLSHANPEAALARGGLLALALRERRKLIGSWDGIPRELVKNGSNGDKYSTLSVKAWETAAACLYGLLPDPHEMLAAFIAPGGPPGGYILALHALLSNPMPPEETIKSILRLLENLRLPDSLAMMHILAAQRPAIAAEVVNEFPIKGLFQDKLIYSSTHKDTDLYFKQISELEAYLADAEARQMAKDYPQAGVLLDKALQATHKLQANLQSRQAQLHYGQGKLDLAQEYWRKAVDLSVGSAENTIYRSWLAQVLLEKGRPAEALQLVPEEKHGDEYDPLVVGQPQLEEHLHSEEQLYGGGFQFRLAEAWNRLERGEADLAYETALALLDRSYLSKVTKPDLLTCGLNLLAKLFFELGRPTEAENALQKALQLHPNRTDLLTQLARAQEATGKKKEAISTLQTTSLLAPDRIDLRRWLARSLEAQSAWEFALSERRVITEIAPPESLTADDWLSLANCAIRADHPHLSQEACQEVLKLTSDDTQAAKAHRLLGESQERLLDPAAARNHYNESTRLDPQASQAWLALARLMKDGGQTQKALDTLRAAALASPDSAEIHYTIGEAYLADWEGRGHPAPTQALVSFEQAYRLSNNQEADDIGSLIALKLGQTLQRLGHLKDARQILAQAYQTDPRYPGLAYAYAQSLIDLGETANAIQPLEIVLESKPIDSGPYLNYAQTLISTGQRPRDAALALQQAIQIEPNNWEAQALLGEALNLAGVYSEAMETFQFALESTSLKDTRLISRISLGLADSALALGRPDTALAALHAAQGKDPDNPHLFRALSDAYLAANLTGEAVQSARAALRLSLDDLEILEWYGKQALNWFGQASKSDREVSSASIDGSPITADKQLQVEALNALCRAIQMAPQRLDLMVQYGRLQALLGEESDAKETYHQIISNTKATIQDLFQAGLALLELEEPALAVSCLERALNLDRQGAFLLIDENSGESLAHTLAVAYQKIGNNLSALDTLTLALEDFPENIALHQFKAILLMALDKPGAAVTCLEEALMLVANETSASELHFSAAVILRDSGDLVRAYEHLTKIIHSHRNGLDSTLEIKARALAADLARSALEPQIALALLGGALLPEFSTAEAGQIQSHCDNLENWLDYICLRAEAALDLGDQERAEDSIAEAAALSSKNSATSHTLWIRVLQTRIEARRGDQSQAISNFHKALGEAEWPTPSERFNYGDGYGGSKNRFQIALKKQAHLRILLAVSEAALEFFEWDTGLFLLRKAIDLAPNEPLHTYRLGRGLVLRAEAQRLCQTVDAFQHSPGVSALAEHARLTFEEAFESTKARLQAWSQAPCKPGDFKHGMQLLGRWSARGRSVFQPTSQASNDLASIPGFQTSPADGSAYIAAIRHACPIEKASADELSPAVETIAAAIRAARFYPQHPLILVQLALTLALRPENNNEALKAIRQAIKQHKTSTKIYQDTALALSMGQLAIAHFVQSRLAYQVGDAALAREAIKSALEIWPDEPKWRRIASEIDLACDDLDAAIRNLEKAVGLDPKNIDTYLALGKAYLSRVINGNCGQSDQRALLEKSIQALEQACRLAPNQPQAWIILAQAQSIAGDQEQAALSADKALELGPGNPEALLLRSQIALDDQDFQGAYNRLKNTLLIRDDDIKDPEVILTLTRALEGLGRITEAIGIIDKAMSPTETPLPLILEKIRLMELTGGNEAALAALKELGDTFPEEPQVLTPLSIALAKAGHFEASINCAQRALQIAAIHKDAGTGLLSEDMARLHYLLGRLMRQAGQLDQAIYHLCECIELDPGMVEAYLEAGRAYQDRRQPGKALEVYKQAAHIAPRDPRPFSLAGLALKESKNYLEAEDMIRRAAELAPNDISIHRQLGVVVTLNLVHNRSRRSID